MRQYSDTVVDVCFTFSSLDVEEVVEWHDHIIFQTAIERHGATDRSSDQFDLFHANSTTALIRSCTFPLRLNITCIARSSAPVMSSIDHLVYPTKRLV